MSGLAATRVLVLNPGSSSLKISVISEPGDETLAMREIEWGVDEAGTDARAGALDALIHELGADAQLDAVGYRVVHGGSRYRSATVIDDAVVASIAELDALAPLHNRVAVETIAAARARLPEVPHVAAFDTAFHATLPESAWRYALPDEWVERWGIRRYGFHGLSVEWSVERAAMELDRSVGDLDLVVAHLGSGCSVTAVSSGRSMWTSMGFTPLEGLVMGTRSGSLDPGILLYLLANGTAPEELANGLEHAAGLLALSRGTASVRELEGLRETNERAALALDVFAHAAAGFIGFAATALAHVDAMVFTGGIGEHSEFVRDAICGRLSALAAGTRTLPVLIVEAREDIVIARQTAHVIARDPVAREVNDGVLPRGTRFEDDRP